MNFLRLFLLLCVFVFIGQRVEAQTYPVQVAVTAVPPYQNYFASYANEDRLKVTLTFTDFSSPPIDVRLKLIFDSPNFDFESNPVNPPIFTLYPGIPYTLTTSELQAFFQNQLPINGPQNSLTEGPSSFCAEVRAVVNNELLNNTSCGYFFLQYGQPAQQILPMCNSTVVFSESDSEIPDPIQFTFAPPIAPIGLQTEVVNKLCIYNYNENLGQQNLIQPNALIPAINPVIELPLGSNTYVINSIENTLIRGNQYVWYIQSSLPGYTNQFQNNGWSAPCIFTYDEAISLEESLMDGLSIEWKDAEGNDPNPGFYASGESKAQAKWKVVAEEGATAIAFSNYIISYRRKVDEGMDQFDWFHDTVTQLSKSIYQLEPATTYEAYVRGRLGNSETEPTEIREITTDSARVYACGVTNFPPKASIYQPLTYADPGTKVQIGMFQLEMVEVQPTGESGHFSGTGLVPVDFLMGAEAKVRFDNLKIDKDYVVWEGTANVITQGLDAWLEEQYQQFQDPIWVDGVVTAASVSDSLAHVTIDGVDTTFSFPCPTCPVIINDVAGNQVTIYPNGTVIWSTYLDISDEQLDVPDTEIAVFQQNEDETGGFDPYEHTQWHENYEIIRTSNSVNYFVPNKSTQVGATDKVNVSVPKNEYGATEVQLSWNGLSTPLQPTSSSESGDERIFTFDLPAFDDGEVAIYAVSDSFKIGKMNLTVYEIIQKQVVIIPLAGTINETELATYLNETLGEAGIDFTVTISDTVGVSSFASTNFAIPDATLMTKYGPDMRAVRDAYFEEHTEEGDAYYLFVVASLYDTVDNQSYDGYMVRGKNMGFINSSISAQAITHELGHGIGALEHTWKNNGPTRESTNNLMDYNNGNDLLLEQWEELRHPSGNSFWDDEDDFLAKIKDLKFGRLNGTVAANATYDVDGFVTPSGFSISFANPETENSTFVVTSTDEITGDVSSFTLGGISYMSIYCHLDNGLYSFGFYMKEADFDEMNEAYSLINEDFEIGNTIPLSFIYDYVINHKTSLLNYRKSYINENILTSIHTEDCQTFYSIIPYHLIDEATKIPEAKFKEGKWTVPLYGPRNPLYDTEILSSNSFQGEWNAFSTNHNLIQTQATGQDSLLCWYTRIINNGKIGAFFLEKHNFHQNYVSRFETLYNTENENSEMVLNNTVTMLKIADLYDTLDSQILKRVQDPKFNADFIQVIEESRFSDGVDLDLQELELYLLFLIEVQKKVDGILYRLRKETDEDIITMLITESLNDDDLSRLSLKTRIRLLNCLVKDWMYADEENTALRIIGTSNPEDADEMLDELLKDRPIESYMMDDPNYYPNIFSALYSRITGDENQEYVRVMYALWYYSEKYSDPGYSRYNYKNKPMVFDYSSEKLFGFYNSNYNLSTNDNFSFIEIQKETPSVYSPGIDLGTSITTDAIISFFVENDKYYYHPLQPIGVVNVQGLKGEVSLPDAKIPAFILYAFDRINTNSNVQLAGEIALDIVTTVVGVGPLAKTLKYGFKAISTLSKTRKVILAGKAIEFTAGATNLILKYSCDENNTTCQEIQGVLTCIELASLSGDAIYGAIAKSRAKKILQNEAMMSGIRSGDNADEIEEILQKAAGIDDVLDWIDLEQRLRAKLSNLIEEATLNKMITNMKNSGGDGLKLAFQIDGGAFDDIDGYIKLIKNASVDGHSIKAVNQALDKAKQLMDAGKSKSLLHFENATNQFDIDLGIRTSAGSSTYSEVYQFKTNTAPLTKNSIQGASSQLYQAPSTKRIAEFKLSSTDDIASIESNADLVAEFKFQLYEKSLRPTNNVVIDEFHLIASNGQKAKVIFRDNQVKFIRY